jgi:hypothetical protein
MPAWFFGGTRQRTKRLEKSASEGDTRIDDYSGGSLQTIETGSDLPIGIKTSSLPPRGRPAVPEKGRHDPLPRLPGQPRLGAHLMNDGDISHWGFRVSLGE